VGAQALLDMLKVNYTLTNVYDGEQNEGHFISNNKCTSTLSGLIEAELKNNQDQNKKAFKKAAAEKTPKKAAKKFQKKLPKLTNIIYLSVSTVTTTRFLQMQQH